MMGESDKRPLRQAPDHGDGAAYETLLSQALDDPRAFWGTQARRIDWHRPWTTVLDDGAMPNARWFVGGQTNLCHNAVDRHLSVRGDQTALIAASGETGVTRTLSYAALHEEVNAMAAAMQALGVGQGDRVLLYLPMIAEAAIAMLACARIGAIHVVVFGGFAPASLAARIADAAPRLLICADAGFQAGRPAPFKAWVDEAMTLAAYRCPVVVVDRGIVPWCADADRDHDYAVLRQRHDGARVDCVWLDADAPSYVLYTSGTTGAPKGVQRDTGGYAVALMTSLALLFQARPGETLFTTSDLGWVVGHSYGVYGPLLMGMRTVLYEGPPTQPDAGVWWRLVHEHDVDLMLSSATAMRLLKRHGVAHFPAVAPPNLRTLFLAGEPLDAPTSAWVEDALGVPVVDHYWQTETGTPMIALPVFDTATAAAPARRCGSPGRAAPGYRLTVVDEESGLPCKAGEKGVLLAEGILPPGCFTTLWQRDADFRSLYWRNGNGWAYQTFDCAVADADGYLRILGRADDVINVAGKRLGTREIEEVLLADAAVAEVAVVGVAHGLRGQVPVVFAVLRPEHDALGAVVARLSAAVSAQIGAHARPWRIVSVPALPRTRSGKLLRRVLKSVMEGRDARDMNVPDLQDLIRDLSRAFADQARALPASV